MDFYLWRPTGRSRNPKAKAHGELLIAAEFLGYLIDGQQRLTSLEGAFGFYSGEDKGGTELRCYLDLGAPEVEVVRDTRLFASYAGNKTIARRVDGGDPTLIAVARLFEGSDPDLRKETENSLNSLRRMRGWDAKRVDSAMARFDRACKLLDQQVPCTTVYDVEDKEAVEIFSRLNKGGSALKQGDVRAAELARGPAVDVLTKMREFVAGERPKRLGFGFSFAFRALVVFHRETALFSTLKPDWMDVPGPHGRTLRESWRATEQAIAKSLSFVDEQMGWSRRALLPSANAVIVLAAAMEKAEFKLGGDAEQLYRRWLCLTALRGVFQGSVETTINRFHRAIRDFKGQPAMALMSALKRDEKRRIRADEFTSPAQLWGPATQVVHAWAVNREAKDWLSGIPIDALARAGSLHFPGGDLTVHHIFARRMLADVYDNPNRANSPANYALLSRASNSEFGDKRPDEVLSMLTPHKRKLADVQFFGDAAGDKLQSNRYEEFCQWRADRLD